MASGSDATAAISDPLTQGTILVNGEGMERYVTTEHPWYAIVNHPAYAQAPFFTTVGEDGTVHALYLAPNAEGQYRFFNLNGVEFNPQGSIVEGATYMAFANAEMITMSMGGLTIVFDFNH